MTAVSIIISRLLSLIAWWLQQHFKLGQDLVGILGTWWNATTVLKNCVGFQDLLYDELIY